MQKKPKTIITSEPNFFVKRKHKCAVVAIDNNLFIVSVLTA